MTLMKRGVIYDGCPIVAKGTIRINNGEVSIDTMHDLMAVDGKNFATLCDPNAKNEQGDLKEIEALPEIWKAKIDELTTQNERVVAGMKRTVESLQSKLQQEITLKLSFEENLAREKRISEEATQVLMEMRSKLAEEVERVEALKAQLDSAGILLEEKEEKLHELQLLLADREAKVKVHEMREKEALMLAEGLREQVKLLEEERTEEKTNTATLLDDFNEWKKSSEEEIAELKRELEKRKATITTLQNELEIAELEDSTYHQTIASLQKENEVLKHDSDPRLPAQDTAADRRKSSTIKTFLKGISKHNKEKDATKQKDSSKQKKTKWVAATPSM